MYPSCFKEDMPCGRGFEWNEWNGQLKKVLMTNKKISLGSIQWLGYMEHDERFVNAAGDRCPIVSGWNAEEVKVGPFYIDGFCQVDDQKYALEYDGCHWHGCDRCGQAPSSSLYYVRL